MLNPVNAAKAEKKVKRLSIKYYNKGLELARDGKITYAIERLRKSVEYNKKNIDAQNLLGLLYYRLGRVTNAYIHWGISVNINSSDQNRAVDYVDDILNSVDFDSKCKAISIYNEALKLVKKENYDTAIMRLKRGLELNPESVDILNLLSYSYIVQGDEHDAFKYVEKVLKIDHSNPIAKGYKNMIKPEKLSLFAKARENDSESDDSVYSNYINYNVVPKKSHIKQYVFLFAAGLITASLVFGALIIPSVFKHYEREIGSYETDYAVLKNQTNEELEKKNDSIATLTQENESLKSKLDNAGTTSLQERVRTLADVESAYEAGNVEVAADRLVALNTTGFDNAAIETYRRLCKTVLVDAAEQYYNKGQEYQDSGEYDKAKEYYNKCLSCSQDGNEIGLNASFQLGKIAQAQGDNASAAQYFAAVAKSHPVEEIKNEAANFIAEYTGTPVNTDSSESDDTSSDDSADSSGDNTDNSYDDSGDSSDDGSSE